MLDFRQARSADRVDDICENLFLRSFEKTATGNPDHRPQSYENTYALAAALASKEQKWARGVVELMRHLQDCPTASEMARLMESLRDQTNINPLDGSEVAAALHVLNPANGPAAYGTAFMVGLQAGMADRGFGKRVRQELHRTNGRQAVEAGLSAMVELVRRARQAVGLLK